MSGSAPVVVHNATAGVHEHELHGPQVRRHRQLHAPPVAVLEALQLFHDPCKTSASQLGVCWGVRAKGPQI